jgi:hypothetical protein
MNGPCEPSGAPAALAAVAAGIDRVVEVGRPYLSSMLAAAVPTPALLRALAEDLQRAVADPRSVPHPELADPAVYWSAAAWPQAAAIVKQVRGALVEIAHEVLPMVRGAETILEWQLRADLEEHADLRRENPETARDVAIDAIAARCEELHRVVEGLNRIRPEVPGLAAAHAELDRSRRRRAEHDVKHRRSEQERAHPDLDKHEFKRWWTATYPARVARRDGELRAEPPFRHQELLLRALDQACAAVDADIDAMIGHLTEPILGIGERLVLRYDSLAAVA